MDRGLGGNESQQIINRQEVKMGRKWIRNNKFIKHTMGDRKFTNDMQIK